MTIEKLFTEYWSQFTLLLIGFGYFIKRIFDNISKRQEINHSLFQQKKLEVANSFFSTYAKAELIFTHIKSIKFYGMNLLRQRLTKWFFQR
jgi:hypothetical protein